MSLAILGESFRDFLSELGGTVLFLARILRTLFTTRGNLRPILTQVAYISVRSVSTVAFSGVFVGAILVLEFNQMLVKFDAQSFLGGLNTSASIRQVGPLIISFLLAGKIGAFTAAELGTMRVTEQIDAVECLGINPIQYLVVPRFIGIVISGILLLILGLIISVLGSMGVAQLFCGINFLRYLGSVPRFVSAWTFGAAIFQSMIYSVIVGLVATYKGYTASNGARGVGRAVTMAAVYTNFYIVIANYLSSELLEYFHEVVSGFLRGIS